MLGTMRMVSPDKLIDGEKADADENAASPEWVIRLERRDVECRFYFIDNGGRVNARLSSAMRMEKDVAKQYAKVITELHPTYKTRAMLYTTMRKKQEEKK